MATGFLSSSSLSSSNRALSTNSLRSYRAIVLMMLATILMGVCTTRLAQLQIVEGAKNRQLAERNRVRLIPIASDRGNIVDRKGRLLAANRLARSVYLWPKEQSATKWQALVPQLAKVLELPRQEIVQKLERVGYHSSMPVRVRQDLTPAAFIRLAEYASQLPGVEVRAESNRYYPQGSLAAHVLGYISEATADDLQEHPEFPMGMLVGRMGIERIEDTQLRGIWGSRLVEVDVTGQELGILGIDAPQSGDSVRLTLDVDLQRTAEQALANRRGAVVVLDVKTGAVLALASGPTFDPNLFTRKVTKTEWSQLQSQDKPFLNRALQGYPPGSTFKVVTAVAGIESGKYSPDSTVGTAAFISMGGVQFWEHGNSGYGVIGFADALAYSSNTFFYQVGLNAGPEQISKWGKRLGISTSRDMDLDGASHGALPTPGEKQKLYGEPWYGGDTVTMAIGQGLVQVTPLELAVVYAAIANGGWRVKPHLLTSQTYSNATKREPTKLHPSTIAVLRSGLESVVLRGTGRQLSDGSIPLVAGKTGTAEVPGQPDNALFASYGPAKNPQISVAVVVENGGYGAVSAVPIAHEIYKTYFGKVAGKKP